MEPKFLFLDVDQLILWIKYIANDVLHVPDFPLNLLFVARLTKDFNYTLTFSSDHYVIQDLATGKRIGIGLTGKGLYRLPSTSHSTLVSARSHIFRQSESYKMVMMWHDRLGHIPFSGLYHMFPKLYRDVSISQLFCEVCQMAKHLRSFYPYSISHSSRPFGLVHSDI